MSNQTLNALVCSAFRDVCLILETWKPFYVKYENRKIASKIQKLKIVAWWFSSFLGLSNGNRTLSLHAQITISPFIAVVLFEFATHDTLLFTVFYCQARVHVSKRDHLTCRNSSWTFRFYSATFFIVVLLVLHSFLRLGNLSENKNALCSSKSNFCLCSDFNRNILQLTHATSPPLFVLWSSHAALSSRLL